MIFAYPSRPARRRAYFNHASRLALLAGLTLGTISPALADETPGDDTRADIRVDGRREQTLARPAEAIGATIDAGMLERANTITAEDALRYLPNIQLRQRYIGDTGSAVTVRGTSGFQTARVLVTLDGVPISNFLGNTYVYAPLWGMVAPDEIESVDASYGPFSARYGGGTMGAGIFIQTRMPQKLEAGVDLTYGNQDFNAQKSSDSLNTWRIQSHIGDRHGNLSWMLYQDHLSSQGQPLYFAVTPVSAGTSAAGTPVAGALRDRDATNTDRYLLGSSGVTDTRSDLVKGKLAWDAAPTTRVMLTTAYRDLRYDSLAPETYLRDAAGNGVISGSAQIDGRGYALSSLLGLRKQDVQLRDLLSGISLTSQLTHRLHAELSASTYNVLGGETRQAYPAGNGAQVIATDAQGWANAAARFAWDVAKRNQIGFGGDYAQYWTQTSTWNSTDWLNGARSSFAERSGGKSETFGLYGEDRWTITPTLTLTAGLRYDHWRAFDGQRTTTASALIYPSRAGSGWSPKGVLRWAPAKGWAVQLRAAQAWRFPTVTELFQSASSGGVLVQSDPHLKPEHATTFDLGTTRDMTLAGGTLSLGATLFHERVSNTLYNQQNAFTGATYYQNIGLVRTRGVELSATGRHLFDGLLDLDGAFAWQGGKILQNANLPASMGKEMPRVPRIRWNLLATLHPVEKVDATVGVRHEGAQFSDLLNSDGRRGGFGYADAYTFVEARLGVHITRQLQASVGVDNLFNQIRYIYHPYPGRTVFLALKWRAQ
ncbi:TonB-dependent receptor [Novosphingobium rosa]|uniref:TonB-dependent receptor n=1 Tax=Novosphingobium rosa TaxID=76978 RepID=UPI00083675FD|nr:TonB-dependent receptor [Novosphingobium rosa]